MDFLKTLTGKIVSGAVGLAVVAAGISWWQMDAGTRQMLISGTGRIIAWLGIVLFLPWVTFFVSTWASKKDSNIISAVVVLSYTILELLLLGWLFEWHFPTGVAWTFFAVGGLFAGAYNLLTCDWLAERLR